MSEKRLTLYELNHLVKDVLESEMPDEYWVEAELSECRESKGHCYMELIQKDERSATPIAKASAKCWVSKWMLIRPYFERTTGQRLHAGMFDLQKELQLPLFCQNIAVISSETAAGYGDFCNQLTDNPYGFLFHTQLFPAIMQGDGVEQSVINALEEIFDVQSSLSDMFDCVVIIRGGGATSDMSGFDTLALAENVANFPIPIITGIGHERDESILDMVSYLRVKTPTAAAAFLIEHLKEVRDSIEDLQNRMIHCAQQKLSTLNSNLSAIAFLNSRSISAECSSPPISSATRSLPYCFSVSAR